MLLGSIWEYTLHIVWTIILQRLNMWLPVLKAIYIYNINIYIYILSIWIINIYIIHIDNIVYYPWYGYNKTEILCLIHMLFLSSFVVVL